MENSLETLKELKTDAEVRRWKQERKKVVGWLCTYIPEEIIYAANMWPFRIMGSGNGASISETEAYLYSNTCSFARCCLGLRLSGDYNFLDGLVAGTSCDHIRRLFEVWQRYFPLSFTHLISIPHKITDQAYDFFKLELVKFKERIEDFFNVEITEHSLAEAIKVHNRTRSALRKLYDLRKAYQPPVSGVEVQEILNLTRVLHRAQYNRWLDKCVDEIKTRKKAFPAKIRLVLSGAVLDDPQVIAEIENLGAVVVADELCTGGNYFWDPVDEDSAPLDALARRYLQHTPCARIRPSQIHFQHLMRLAEDFKADGIIMVRIKFCDLYGYDNVLFKDELKKRNIPILELEQEYTKGCTGQAKTRIQAFLEMLGAKHGR